MFTIDPLVAILAKRKGASLRDTLLLSSALPVTLGRSSVASKLIVSDVVTTKVVKGSQNLILKTSSSSGNVVRQPNPVLGSGSEKLPVLKLNQSLKLGTPIPVFSPDMPTETANEVPDEVEVKTAIIDKIAGKVPLTLDFQSPLVEDGMSYKWDFGDKKLSSSDAANPNPRTYNDPGKYEVTLTVMNKDGWKYQFKVDVEVT